MSLAPVPSPAPHEGLVPPQSLEAEESVLGAMMISPLAIEAVIDVVDGGDFYRESHGRIFRAAVALHGEGKPVDAITLTAALEARGELEKVGGRVRLYELANLVPASANAAHYARIVHDTATKRGLIRAGAEIAQLGWEGTGELEELLAKAEGYLTGVTTERTESDLRPLTDGIDDLWAELEEAVRTGQERVGMPTGFIDLDEVLGGLRPGQLVIVAARPSMGKSAFAQNVAENIADAGTPTGFFSLEMSREELQVRMLARASRVDSKKLARGRLTPPEVEKARSAIARLKERRNLYVEDRSGVSPATLRAEAQRMKRQHGIGVLVVDYLQLMIPPKAHSRNDEVGAITRSLKILAGDLQVPIIALSQLNRNLETRENKRPVLSDLRDSGSVEQDADAVLFLYRDSAYNPNSPDVGLAEVIVAKNRMGECKTTKLTYIARWSSFNNLSRAEETS